MRTDGYLPIAGYALIGDCRSAALVGEDGSIDWLCLPRFDGPSVFGRILDATQGGSWQIEPVAPYQVHQRYRDRTNLLDTVFSTGSGLAVVTDFMPLHQSDLRLHGRPHDEPRVIRMVECLSGSIELRHTFDPRPDYGRSRAVLTSSVRHLHADSGELHLCLVSSTDLPDAEQTLRLAAGESVAFALRAGRAGHCGELAWSVERAHRQLRQTQQFWWHWISQIRYTGPYQVPVWRSALALKLMTYSPTGAIIAAPTTSLPEAIGGQRNWDYRFTWLRDASFTLYAFFQLGLTEEANSFFHWLTHRHLGEGARNVPNLIDVSGHVHVQERELTHLSGYRGSRPVRVGNAAVHQLQLDVYGEILDSAYLYARFGGAISRALWAELRAVVELAIERWASPDSSIWEVRSEPLHYTYSKLMCWVAVDRGLRIAERYGLSHDAARWKSARRAMHRRITVEAYSTKLGSFTQYLGGEPLDAAVLRISQVRFLGNRDPRIRSTVRAIERHLGVGGTLVRRYDTDVSEDGLPGDEGAFFMCAFWLVDALAHVGDLEAAQRLFERLLTFGSPCGLFAEEVDERTGELLGNYPQAFTHLALVGAAVNIERARHRRIGARGLHRPQPAPAPSPAPSPGGSSRSRSRY